MLREVARLSPGTQVVLRAGVRLSINGSARRPGFIGEIMEVIDDPEESYVVHFTDGATFTLPRRQLVVRRTLMTAELDMLAPESVNWAEYIIYRVRIGSRAYGLEGAESDEESLRSVFLPPAMLHWSLHKPMEQIEQQRPAHKGAPGMEEILWEVEKFVRLGLAGNPGVIEALYSPSVVVMTDLGQELRAIREAFLSRLIFSTFTGYAISQFRKMQRARDRAGEEAQPRHTMHLIRLLLAGLGAARTGEPDVTAQAHHTELGAIRTGRMSFDEAFNWAMALQRQFDDSMAVTPLPDLPDYETANAFLIRARARSVDLPAPQ
jgi:uncharacterized protein